MPRLLLPGIVPVVHIRRVGGGPPPVYVIDQAVGRAAPNDRADVLLVQYLLRVATEKAFAQPAPMQADTVLAGSYTPPPPGGLRAAIGVAPRHTPHPPPPARPPLPDTSPIVIDGVCGPQTIAFIEYFQATQPTIPARDGRVEPPAPSTPTLAALNAVLFAERQGMIFRLFADGAFPAELREYFYDG
ncbi:hypothetical protein J421_2434 [Gemmatirosa kalamazoonensis]|uniref:Uncharacterized protein n=1 Tax=Gemmatirosa kalamazoonensis TaxID=861299 RepID=W0RGR4_9BACT|nr:hypothetical protein [Gemmatirosa kalamazoonensis]AHG89971.1 hypothetical protein J421_2434 [Gemmatirosa kalamazoonensis]